MRNHYQDVVATYARYAGFALIMLSSTLSLRAASIWDGGGTDSNWSTAANWNLDTAPSSGTATDIQMAGTTRLDATVDSAFTLRTLVFSSGAGAFNLSGNTITVAGTGADSNGVENQSSSLVTINNNFVLSGPAQFKATSGDMILNGGINLNGVSGANFKSAAGKTLTVSGVVSGSVTATLGFNSGGTVYLGGANTFTAGAVSIFNSTVIVGVNSNATSGAFGAGTSTIMLGTSGSSMTPSVMMGGQYTLARNLQIVSNGTAATSATIGTIAAGSSTISGNITNGSANVAAQALTFSAVAGGRLNVTGDIVRASGATGTADTMTKTGSGVINLAGTNAYQGATAVNQGTLLVTGTLSSGGGAVSVASGAMLGGNGVINRAVTVTGTLTPGDMDASGNSVAGTLTLGSGLVLNTGSALKFDLGANSDLISITGDLTLDGALDVTALSGFGLGSYTLFTYTGVLTDHGLDLGTLPSGYTYSLDTDVTGIVSLNVVPEPSVVVMVAGSILMLIGFRARNRSRSA